MCWSRVRRCCPQSFWAIWCAAFPAVSYTHLDVYKRQEHVVIATYNLFINDIEPVSFDGNKAVLSVRSEFVKNTLENRYLSLLQEAFRELLGFEAVSYTHLLQSASSVENRMAFALFVFKMERFAGVMPMAAANSVEDIFRFAIITSRFTTIGMKNAPFQMV